MTAIKNVGNFNLIFISLAKLRAQIPQCARYVITVIKPVARRKVHRR